MKCKLCPRNCNINREEKAGFCGVKKLKIAKVMRHFWEEPIISGTNGSGAIFFSGCNLKCCFCQNFAISMHKKGKNVSILDLISIFQKIEEAGCENINLVSPSHFTSEIIEALKIYKPKIPVIWNSNGFEKASTIKKLKKLVDVYLVDLKYLDENIAQKYSLAKNYPKIAKKAILRMRKNQPKDIIQDNLLRKGMIIRHLILPNATKNSLDCINWIYKKLGNKTIISLMSQYTPCYKAKNFKEINRKIKKIEYKAVLNKAKKLGFENCFYQDIGSASEDYIPNFDRFWELN